MSHAQSSASSTSSQGRKAFLSRGTKKLKKYHFMKSFKKDCYARLSDDDKDDSTPKEFIPMYRSNNGVTGNITTRDATAIITTKNNPDTITLDQNQHATNNKFSNNTKKTTNVAIQHNGSDIIYDLFSNDRKKKGKRFKFLNLKRELNLSETVFSHESGSLESLSTAINTTVSGQEGEHSIIGKLNEIVPVQNEDETRNMEENDERIFCNTKRFQEGITGREGLLSPIITHKEFIQTASSTSTTVSRQPSEVEITSTRDACNVKSSKRDVNHLQLICSKQLGIIQKEEEDTVDHKNALEGIDTMDYLEQEGVQRQQQLVNVQDDNSINPTKNRRGDLGIHSATETETTTIITPPNKLHTTGNLLINGDNFTTTTTHIKNEESKSAIPWGEQEKNRPAPPLLPIVTNEDIKGVHEIISLSNNYILQDLEVCAVPNTNLGVTPVPLDFPEKGDRSCATFTTDNRTKSGFELDIDLDQAVIISTTKRKSPKKDDGAFISSHGITQKYMKAEKLIAHQTNTDSANCSGDISDSLLKQQQNEHRITTKAFLVTIPPFKKRSSYKEDAANLHVVNSDNSNQDLFTTPVDNRTLKTRNPIECDDGQAGAARLERSSEPIANTNKIKNTGEQSTKKNLVAAPNAKVAAEKNALVKVKGVEKASKAHNESKSAVFPTRKAVEKKKTSAATADADKNSVAVTKVEGSKIRKAEGGKEVSTKAVAEAKKSNSEASVTMKAKNEKKNVAAKSSKSIEVDTNAEPSMTRKAEEKKETTIPVRNTAVASPTTEMAVTNADASPTRKTKEKKKTAATTATVNAAAKTSATEKTATKETKSKALATRKSVKQGIVIAAAITADVKAGQVEKWTPKSATLASIFCGHTKKSAPKAKPPIGPKREIEFTPITTAMPDLNDEEIHLETSSGSHHSSTNNDDHASKMQDLVFMTTLVDGEYCVELSLRQEPQDDNNLLLDSNNREGSNLKQKEKIKFGKTVSAAIDIERTLLSERLLTSRKRDLKTIKSAIADTTSAVSNSDNDKSLSAAYTIASQSKLDFITPHSEEIIPTTPPKYFRREEKISNATEIYLSDRDQEDITPLLIEHFDNDEDSFNTAFISEAEENASPLANRKSLDNEAIVLQTPPPSSPPSAMQFHMNDAALRNKKWSKQRSYSIGSTVTTSSGSTSCSHESLPNKAPKSTAKNTTDNHAALREKKDDPGSIRNIISNDATSSYKDDYSYRTLPNKAPKSTENKNKDNPTALRKKKDDPGDISSIISTEPTLSYMSDNSYRTHHSYQTLSNKAPKSTTNTNIEDPTSQKQRKDERSVHFSADDESSCSFSTYRDGSTIQTDEECQEDDKKFVFIMMDDKNKPFLLRKKKKRSRCADKKRKRVKDHDILILEQIIKDLDENTSLPSTFTTTTDGLSSAFSLSTIHTPFADMVGLCQEPEIWNICYTGIDKKKKIVSKKPSGRRYHFKKYCL